MYYTIYDVLVLCVTGKSKLPSLECGGFFVIQIYILSGAGDGGVLTATVCLLATHTNSSEITEEESPAESAKKC